MSKKPRYTSTKSKKRRGRIESRNSSQYIRGIDIKQENMQIKKMICHEVIGETVTDTLKRGKQP